MSSTWYGFFLMLVMFQCLLSDVGYVPTLNVHLDVWDCVESYTIYMLLTCRLKITFTFSLKLIIFFLVQLQHLLLPSLLKVTSSQVRVGTPLPPQLCCISGLGPEGLLQNLTRLVCPIPSTYIGMLSPASGPEVLHWGDDVESLPPHNLTMWWACHLITWLNSLALSHV